MVLYWTYYIRCVRREPRSEAWYDELDWDGAVSDGVLVIYPYCSLIMGVAGAAGLVTSANPPELVHMMLKIVLQRLSSPEVLGSLERSGFRSCGLLFRGGSLTSTKQNVLDGASVEKPGKGKQKNKLGSFTCVRSALKSPLSNCKSLSLVTKASQGSSGRPET